MKTLKYILIYTIFIFLVQNSIAQVWNTTGNTLIGGEVLGGDATSVAPLELKTITSFPINFYTVDLQRMRIESGGNVQVGDAVTAQALLHLNKTAGNTAVFMRFSNGTTGPAANHGFAIGYDNTQQVQLRNWENSPILFYTTMNQAGC